MANRFMMSVAAAALIAGSGFAYAQGTGMSRDTPSGGSTVQQNAPSTDRGGSSAQEPKGPSSGMKATQSDQKSPGGAKNQRAQDDMKAGPKGDKSAQDNMNGEKSKSMSSETKGPAAKDMKAEDRNGNMNAESKGAADSRSQTTGQVGAGAKLSGEQRTRITGVFREQRIEPLTNANFSIVVGSRVPRDITFHQLPAEIVTIYPEWRGYEFVRVRDQILVINPRTLEIVAVLET